MQQSLVDLQAYDTRRLKHRRLIKEMPVDEQPYSRMDKVGLPALSTAEVMAIALGNRDGLDLATDIMARKKRLTAIRSSTRHELAQEPGVGEVTARKLLAILELGRRFSREEALNQPRITSPADFANYLMADMMYLEKEHLVVLTLNTRNYITGEHTVYIGSLNTSVLRLAEVFQVGIRNNAAAILVAHNHPSGDPTPSPEDVNVTRQLVAAGKLLDLELLDHIVIGHHRYVSLKERGLGFD
ncbi:MAG: DNA repair protein RadC [Anaerolineales bacterium]|nr:DNA repair protein RadC [Anaerolineales bacterium]